MSQIFSKYPDEYFMIAVDFSENMKDGEVINLAESSISATKDTGEDMSSVVLSQSSKVVTDDILLGIKVQNGSSGDNYTITFKAKISDDKLLRKDVIMQIM
jgi:hypothetical protein